MSCFEGAVFVNGFQEGVCPEWPLDKVSIMAWPAFLVAAAVKTGQFLILTYFSPDRFASVQNQFRFLG
jgi:hypothetical protein